MFSDNNNLKIKGCGSYYSELYDFETSNNIVNFKIKIFDVKRNHFQISSIINVVKQKSNICTILVVDSFRTKTGSSKTLDMIIDVGCVKKQDFFKIIGTEKLECLSAISCSADIIESIIPTSISIYI